MNKTSPRTINDLFDKAISLEHAAESLYLHFAEIFSEYPEVSRFWKSYADEEKGHAAYLERARNSADPERLASPADEGMFAKVQHCLDIASHAKMKTIKTLDDAYQMAIELENSETNTIFEFMIVNFSTEELMKSHKFLKQQISSHVARLENDFPPPYNQRTARQNVLAAQ